MYFGDEISYNDNGKVNIKINATESSINLPIDVYELMIVNNQGIKSVESNGFMTPKYSYKDYQNTIRPAIIKELNYMYSNWNNILKEAFDKEMAEVPKQTFKDYAKPEMQKKVFEEMVKLYALTDQKQVISEIDKYAKGASKKDTVVLANVHLTGKFVDKITTKEYKRDRIMGWVGFLTAVLPGLGEAVYAFSIAAFIHYKGWKGHSICNRIQNHLHSASGSSEYTTTKQYNKNGLKKNSEQHLLLYKMKFKIK